MGGSILSTTTLLPLKQKVEVYLVTANTGSREDGVKPRSSRLHVPLKLSFTFQMQHKYIQ